MTRRYQGVDLGSGDWQTVPHPLELHSVLERPRCARRRRRAAYRLHQLVRERVPHRRRWDLYAQAYLFDVPAWVLLAWVYGGRTAPAKCETLLRVAASEEKRRALEVLVEHVGLLWCEGEGCFSVRHHGESGREEQEAAMRALVGAM